MLALEGLQKRFGDTQALDGVSLTVGPGEVVGFVGSNGAGKSTTMRIAMGLLAPDAGTVPHRRARVDRLPSEEVGSVLSPMSVLLFVACGTSFATAAAPDGTVARVFSLLPPFSALNMPGRMASGTVPALEVGLAMLLMLALTAGTLLVGARVYRASVLPTGSRLSLRRAWASEAVR